VSLLAPTQWAGLFFGDVADRINVTMNVLEHIAVPEPLVFVVFGASGDLAHRKLIPAVFKLWCDKLLPDQAVVLGYARSKKSDQQFRTELHESVKNAFDDRGFDFPEDQWKKFASRVSYHQGFYDSESDFQGLRDQIEYQAAEKGLPGNCIFYLATPPDAFAPIVNQLHRCGLARRGEQLPWSRIVIEKPFGSDLQSARILNDQLGDRKSVV